VVSATPGDAVSTASIASPASAIGSAGDPVDVDVAAAPTVAMLRLRSCERTRVSDADSDIFGVFAG